MKGCTVPRPLTWPSNKKSNGTEEFVTTSSVDGYSVLLKTHIDGTRLRVDTTHILFIGCSLPLCELPERGQSFTSNRLSGSILSPDVFTTRGYFHKKVGFEISFFPLLVELPKNIEPHLPVCGGGFDPIPCVSTHRISDPRSGPAQLLPPHVKQRSYPHGVRPQIPDR